jgi:uncharacterized membrane-anchored protein YhcB (DUF1043 family)
MKTVTFSNQIQIIIVNNYITSVDNNYIKRQIQRNKRKTEDDYRKEYETELAESNSLLKDLTKCIKANQIHNQKLIEFNNKIQIANMIINDLITQTLKIS